MFFSAILLSYVVMRTIRSTIIQDLLLLDDYNTYAIQIEHLFLYIITRFHTVNPRRSGSTIYCTMNCLLQQTISWCRNTKDLVGCMGILMSQVQSPLYMWIWLFVYPVIY